MKSRRLKPVKRIVMRTVVPVGDVADCMEALGENISLKTSARQDCYFAPLFAASAMTALPSTR